MCNYVWYLENPLCVHFVNRIHLDTWKVREIYSLVRNQIEAFAFFGTKDYS